MIPERDNKKGAFAPFDNRTVVIVILSTQRKLPFSVQSIFQVVIPTTKALVNALLFLSAPESNPTFLKHSSHSEP